MAELASRRRETRLLTLALGLGLIAMVEVMRRLTPRVPGALLVFVLAAAVAFRKKTADRAG